MPIAGGAVELDQADTVHEAFEARARRTPGATAVVVGHRRFSYAEIDRYADRVALALRRRGAGPDTVVGVCLPRGSWLVPGLLGVLKAGAGYLPLDPTYPAERIRLVIADAAPGQVLTDAASAGLVAQCGADPVQVEDLPEPVVPTGGRRAGAAGDLAYVFYTSGSTGRPKGAAIEHRNALALLRWAARTYTAEELAGSLAATSICFDFSVLELFAPLCTGGTVLLAEQLLALPGLPARDEVRMLCGVPPVVAALLERPLPAGVRTVNLGGEVLTGALRDRVYANPGVRRVLNLYGPAECTTACLAQELRPGEPGEPPLGAPIAGAELLVLDPAGRPVQDGDLGELWVAGPGVGRGYLNQPALTRERFVADPAVAGARRYRTGDLVRRIAGRYHFGGRADDQVKVRGVRVELGEVRAALAAHPAVRLATVLAPPDGSGTRRLIGYVEPAEPVTEPELRGWLRARLPSFLLPERVAVLDRLPLQPNGKVDQAALPALPAAPAGATGREGPRGPTEAQLATLVAGVLGVPAVGRTDDFTELGGHSLAAARVVSQVAGTLGVSVPVGRFLAEPTVAGLARLVAAGEPAPPDSAREPAPPDSGGPAGGRYPPTDPQRQFWTLRQVSPTREANTIGLRLALSGVPSGRSVRAALDALVARHDALRTVLVDQAGELVAQVRPARPVELAELDLRDAGDPAGAAARVARELAAAGFDGSTDLPLLRAALLWTGARTAELVLVIDHSGFDGGSVGVLLPELAAGIAGQPPAGPAPQLSSVATGDPARDPAGSARRYWQQALVGAVPPDDLPGRTRTAAPRHAGDRLVRRLDQSLVAGLRQVAARHRATPAAVWLAGLAVLVDCLTGRPDTLLGVAAATRDRPGLDRVVGPLLTVLPVRIDLSDDPPLGALARRAFAGTRAALEHAALPTDERLRLAGIERPAGAPLTPVVLSVQPEDVPVTARHREVAVRLLGELATGAAPYDLTVLVNATAEGPELQLEYAGDRFGPAAAEAVADRLLRIMAAMVADPDRPVSGVDLLLPGEREWLLAAGGGTPAGHGRPTSGGTPAGHGGPTSARTPAGGPAPATVVHGILDQAARRPDAVAVVGPAGRLTYRELAGHSARVAAALVAAGARPDLPVGVCLPRDHLLPATLLGVLRAGAPYLPLEPDLPPERLRYQAEQAGARLLVTAPETAGAVAGLAGATRLDAAELAAAGGAGQLPEIRPDTLAYLLYTSGSTGRPKGVEVEHASLAGFVAGMAREPGCTPEDVFLAVSPLSFDISCADLWVPLAAGASTVVVDRATATDGAALAARIGQVDPTTIDLPPTLLRMLLAAGWPGSPRLRVFSGGEPLDPALATELLGRVKELWNMYGPTEATVTASLHRVVAAPDGPVPIGHPAPGTRLYVLDRAGRLAPPGVTGELWIGGAGVARGYRDRPDLTAAAFADDPYRPARHGRRYRSGDLARWRPDRTLEFAGRRDSQVKLRGIRIELGEVESVLAEHPAVRQAAVTVTGAGTPDAALAGYAVPRPGWQIDPAMLVAHARLRLPEAMVPHRWLVLPELPRTPAGKLDRRALPAPPGSARQLVPPRTETERFVAEVWAEVLGRAEVGATDEFFALGGHSLAATRVTGRLRERLGIDLPVAALFDRPVLADFAAELERILLAELAAEGAR
jgi:amino acid adenylation domain-containing protein